MNCRESESFAATTECAVNRLLGFRFGEAKFAKAPTEHDRERRSGVDDEIAGLAIGNNRHAEKILQMDELRAPVTMACQKSSKRIEHNGSIAPRNRAARPDQCSQQNALRFFAAKYFHSFRCNDKKIASVNPTAQRWRLHSLKFRFGKRRCANGIGALAPASLGSGLHLLADAIRHSATARLHLRDRISCRRQSNRSADRRTRSPAAAAVSRACSRSARLV